MEGLITCSFLSTVAGVASLSGSTLLFLKLMYFVASLSNSASSPGVGAHSHFKAVFVSTFLSGILGTLPLFWALQCIAAWLPSLCDCFWLLDSMWHCLSSLITLRGREISLWVCSNLILISLWIRLESKNFIAVGSLSYSNYILLYWQELAGDASIMLSTACLPLSLPHALLLILLL